MRVRKRGLGSFPEMKMSDMEPWTRSIREGRKGLVLA